MDIHQSVVIDNGTTLTKMGYSGNLEPDLVIPTAITDLTKKNISSQFSMSEEYNYYIGEEAISMASKSDKYSLIFPIQKGIIENWDQMEKFWHQSLFKYLRCDPLQHYFILTETPINSPVNREKIAEIFFETFNVPGLFIGNQALLALIGFKQYTFPYDSELFDHDETLFSLEENQAIKELTGIVVESGDSVTYVVPICN